MKLQHFSVRRPVTVMMCLVATLVIGLVAFNGLGVDLLPSVEYPTLAIVTLYPNADPESVEHDVTQPIERALSTVSGLKALESTSMEHVSLVMATMDWGSDLGEAFEQINALLSVASLTLPSDAQRPIVAKLDTSQLPVMTIGVTGEGDLAALTARVEEAVVPVLERLTGVAQVSLLGGAHKQIAIYYDTQALRSALLTPLDLQTMLQLQNAVVPVGSMVVSQQELGLKGDALTRYPIRVGDTIDSLDELRDLPISISEAKGPADSFGLSSLIPPQPVRLGDVATVVEETQSAEGFTRVNGEPAVVIRVFKQSGENTVDVSRRVNAMIEQLNAQPGLGLELYVVTDQAEFIDASIANLAKSALQGAVLALGVLLLFLRSVRDLIVIGISIPLSFLVALILMYFGDLTLNLMTLGGLAIAVGMLVDNAIVVLENIFRLRSEGLDRIKASIQGASEMAGAVTASTLTNVVVFVPLIFLRSLAGYLFKDLALTITLAMLASLLVSLTVVPMLAAHLPESFGRRVQRKGKGADHNDEESGGGFLRKVQDAYGRLLRPVVARPLHSLAVLGISLMALLFLPGLLQVGFVPEMDGGMVTVALTLPPGTPVTETDAVVRDFEAFLAAVPEVRLTSVQVGSQGGNDYLSLIQDTPVNQATITALLTPAAERSRSAHEVAEALRASLPVPEGGRVRISADRAVDALGDDFSLGLTLEVIGPEWEVLRQLSDHITAHLRETPGLVDVNSTAEATQPVLFYEVNRIQAARALMATGQVGLTLRVGMNGLEATTLHGAGGSVPVVIKPNPDELQDMAALESYRLFTLQKDEDGVPNVVRFGAVTSPESPVVAEAPRTIQHIDRQRVVIVKAQLDGLDLGSARRAAEEIIGAMDLPAGYEVRLAGIHATLDESLGELWVALGLSVLFVYMVMAAQFESLRSPLIVMITVPLAGVGAFLALWLSGQQLNVPAFMGLITLVGVAVNNGIVLVDTINRLRRDGIAVDEAILTAARIRLRPILMTALTTILGLIPLAFSWGEGSEIQVPLAMSTMGGLITSTLLTLFLVPALYRLFAGHVLRSRSGDQVGTSSF